MGHHSHVCPKIAFQRGLDRYEGCLRVPDNPCRNNLPFYSKFSEELTENTKLKEMKISSYLCAEQPSLDVGLQQTTEQSIE